jgi:AraC-like DNA-binding protein
MEILAPIFGFFTSFILIYYLSALNRSNIFLALFFLCCNLIVLVYFGLHFSNNQFWEAIFFVHFLPLSYIIGPLLFIYVRTTISDNKQFKKTDWLHFIPAFLILIATSPYTSLPFDKKFEIAHQIVKITENYSLNFYFVSFEFILYSRSIHLIIYAIISFFYFRYYTKKIINTYGIVPTNHLIINRWINILIIIQILIAGNSLGHMTTLYHKFSVFGIKSTDLFSELYFFRICGGAFVIQNFILFLFPKILYGNISYQVLKQNEGIIDDIKSNIAKKDTVTSVSENLNLTLNPYLESLPFIKQGFSISQMSFDLKISERVLSNYFNKVLSKTFGEWKNDQRINYVCQIIEQGKAKDITIEAISINAGFVSRSKFIDAFKERKGVTPSAYIKGLAEIEK